MDLRKRTTKSFCFTIPKPLAVELARVAAEMGRSRSSLIAWLIKRDNEEKIKVTPMPSDSME
jgi:hypothetical protein